MGGGAGHNDPRDIHGEGGAAGAEDGSRDHDSPSATTDHGASDSPGAQDDPTRDYSDGSSNYHRDGGHSGAQDSRAGGANPHSTSGELPAIPDHVSANDHACSTASDHFLCSPNYLCSTNHLLCSSNHLLCSSNHLWRLWHSRRKHHRRG